MLRTIAGRKPDPYGKQVTPTPNPFAIRGGFQELYPPSAPKPAVATNPATPGVQVQNYKPGTANAGRMKSANVPAPTANQQVRETSADLGRMQSLAGIRKN